MRKRGRFRLVAFAVCTAAGLTLALHGTITDVTTTYRLGTILLLVGLAGVIDTRVRIDTYKLIVHQENVAMLSAQERQRFAEMGWKAAILSAAPEMPRTAGGQVVDLPTRRSPEMRKDGSA